MQVQNYTILSKLGEGGMATVYLAEHKLLKNKVALKVLKEEFIRNKNIRNRFLSEARNLATMSHPNIIKVTDLIDEGDTVAFVMEHIDGETLKEFLDRKGKLTDDKIRNIFSQMLDAVGYVHEQGLIHRDIKPSNFMIDKKGKVKLLDFGIAKNTDSSSAEYTQTGTGMQMGTPMYMSPEQITETKSVTAQSDIYSLGVVLWQLVTGERPYNMATLSNFQLQTKIVNEPLSATGSAFDTQIKKATEKDPQNRYMSTSEFFLNSKISNNQNDLTVFNNKTDRLEQTVISPDYDELKKYILFEIEILDKKNEYKYGYVNIENNIVIQPIYEKVERLKNGIKVKTNNKYGLLDFDGNWIIQPSFDDILYLDERDFAVVKLNEKWGFVNRQGDWVIQPSFDEISYFDEKEYAGAKINEKWGFINRQGDWVIQPSFDVISYFDDFIDDYFNEKDCIVDQFSFINTSGGWDTKRIVQKVPNNYHYYFDDKDFASACINGKFGFINRQGNWVIQPTFDNLGFFDDKDFAPACINREWGFINRSGNWVIQPSFDEITYFDEKGYAGAKINKKWGFINRQGNWVIQPTFDYIGFFDDKDFAPACINGKWGFVNRQGNWVIQPSFDEITYFDEKGYAGAKINEKWGFINRQGNWIIQSNFDDVDSFYNKDIANVKINGKWGFINRSGNWVIQPSHNKINKIQNYNSYALIKVCTNYNSYSYFDQNGNEILKGFNYKTIGYTDEFGIEFILVEAGTFMMGASPNDKEAKDYEKPAHKVTLTGSYYIGKYPVTQSQWEKIMGNNPSYFKYKPNCPVETVSWNDCQEFIKKINIKSGCTYRLPTEAEWEFAARGGNKSKGYKYSGSNNLDEVGWYDGNRKVEKALWGIIKSKVSETLPVGQKKPNELGIHDMSGNVCEWCEDWIGKYSTIALTNPIGASNGTGRSCRGGYITANSNDCRISHRFESKPDSCAFNIGLRLVLIP